MLSYACMVRHSGLLRSVLPCVYHKLAESLLTGLKLNLIELIGFRSDAEYRPAFTPDDFSSHANG